ncbi:RNA chaperone ProQ [Pseudidiomarina sediminum]|uniref:RNA chaperone ProQ n=1 Tax=Pseudidiomarina sediminum TaxID=431675 RepID=A0A432ZAX8_9GAMM|nr:RNA chaperone ProQ [Pseudidiomarina sediminum]MBY6063069.1 RNA chaperone ProQ [Pseudidiomarina sediminum]RUO75088.1 RNA chaperone ProQ [Pseudidiomarina sediminum]
MSEVKKLSNNKEVLAYLAEKFPACFSLNGDAKPLQVGIFEELAKRLADDEAVSKTRLRTALRHYTNSWRYLRAMKAGGQRIDLDGNEVGAVEEEHQQHAAEALAKSKAEVAERKKQAEKAARPEAAKPSKTPAKKKVNVPKRRPAAKKPAAPKLEAIDESQLHVGQNVQVKAGKQPVAGQIVEKDRNDVVVQLHNGLTVKVKADAIFIAKQE